MSAGGLSEPAPTGALPPRTPSAGAALARARRALFSDRAALAVAALTALGAALRFWRIGYQGFWFDEGNSALLVQLSPGRMLSLLPKTESTPPLYYCVAWVWARLFGSGEVGLRSLPALAGVLTVPVVGLAARRLISRRVGVAAAALTACNPLLVWYSQEARSYSLLVLLSAATLVAFAAARQEPSRRRLGIWALTCALALGTHYLALLIILPQALLLLAVHRARRALLVALATVTAVGVSLVPLALAQTAAGNSSWIAPLSLPDRLAQVIPEFLLGFQAPAYRVISPLAGGLAAGALLLAWRRGAAGERRGSLIAAALAAAGLVAELLLTLAGADDLITRNLLALWPPAALAVAGGVGADRARRLGALLGLGLCATGAFAVVGVATTRSYQRPDWRTVARVLGPPPAGTGRRALLLQHYSYRLPLSLYMPGLRFWPGSAGVPVRELDVISFTAPRSHLCWWGAACNLSGTRAQHSFPLPGFQVVSRRRVLQFTVVRLRSSRPVTLTPTAIGAALRTTKAQADRLLLQGG